MVVVGRVAHVILVSSQSQLSPNEQSLNPVEKCLEVIRNIDVLENILKINAISVVILEWFIIKIEIHNHKKYIWKCTS